MKKYLSYLILSLTIVIVLTSCRDDGDTLLSYDKFDINYHGYAINSYKEQFEAFWTAMNCNYALWDYEAQFGVDWDKTYDDYISKFIEFDQNKDATDNELFTLYKEIIEPLHDGHLVIQVMNIKTGNYSELISPARIRNLENPDTKRKDYNVPKQDLYTLYYYYWLESTDENKIVDLETRTHFGNTGQDCSYALFKDNIVYYYLSAFNLSDLMEESWKDTAINVWEKWLNKVRELYNDGNGSLKGVIIDVRNNGGGYAKDYKYVLGALQEPNYYIGDVPYYHFGEERYKSGVGRLDYSPLKTPSIIRAYNDRIAISNVPIVILANCNTASTAELVCLGAKSMKNGTVIGTRTWGALSSLSENYTEYYSGIIGEEGKGPFYLYLPRCAFFTSNGEILEGKGVTPDIEVQLDVDEYETTGRDAQLERALEFIRTGK